MKVEFLKNVDKIITTINIAVLHDGSNAPPPRQTLLFVTSPMLILRIPTKICCHMPMAHKMLCCILPGHSWWWTEVSVWLPKATATRLPWNGEWVLYTERNDGLVNSYNAVQLSVWCVNVNIQYCMSCHKVIQYCAKYATNCEPHFQAPKDIFTSIVRSMSDNNTSLKAVQKLLINSVGERDYSAQEACYSYLCTYRDFVLLSMGIPCSGKPPWRWPASKYTLNTGPLHCPSHHLTFYSHDFVQQYTMPKNQKKESSGHSMSLLLSWPLRTQIWAILQTEANATQALPLTRRTLRS